MVTGSENFEFTDLKFASDVPSGTYTLEVGGGGCCTSSGELILYYNPISLIGVMVWTASARYNLVFFISHRFG